MLADYPDTLLVRATPAERQLLQAQKLEAVELEHPPVQVAGASMDHLTIVAGGLRTGYPWSSVDPKQFVQLVRDYWPGLDGKPALGLALWARRHRVDATAKAAPAESGELQYFKLLSEAERALADGALVSARDRFEAALEANRDGKEAKDGLERVARNFEGKTILTAEQIEDVVAYLASLKDPQ